MRLVQIFGVASLVTMASTTANASVIDFAGSTTGCFGAGCTNFKTTTTDHNLSFSGAAFNESITSPATSAAVTLGSFTLTNTGFFNPHFFNNETFDLKVSFTSPSNAGGSINFLADVTGLITVVGGFVNVDFNPSKVSFGSNSYVLDVNDILLLTTLFNGKEKESLTGTINLAAPQVGPSQTSAVPEPSTWAMLMIGFAALGFWGRRSVGAMTEA
jgi:hypothetical protein